MSTITLELIPGLSENEWAAIGKELVTTERQSRWGIGDWMLYGEKNYSRPGDKHRAITLAIQATGLEKRTIREYAEVARKVETGARTPLLPWSLHREVRNLPPEKQSQLLDEAAAFGYSVKQLQAVVKAVTPEKPKVIKGKSVSVFLNPELLAKLEALAGNCSLPSFLARQVVPEWLQWRMEGGEANAQASAKIVELQKPGLAVDEIAMQIGVDRDFVLDSLAVA